MVCIQITILKHLEKLFNNINKGDTPFTLENVNHIKELSKHAKISKDNCIIINDILEQNFFISKKNKDKIINQMVIKLDIDIVSATNIYDTAKLSLIMK